MHLDLDGAVLKSKMQGMTLHSSRETLRKSTWPDKRKRVCHLVLWAARHAWWWLLPHPSAAQWARRRPVPWSAHQPISGILLHLVVEEHC